MWGIAKLDFAYMSRTVFGSGLTIFRRPKGKIKCLFTFTWFLFLQDKNLSRWSFARKDQPDFISPGQYFSDGQMERSGVISLAHARWEVTWSGLVMSQVAPDQVSPWSTAAVAVKAWLLSEWHMATLNILRRSELTDCEYIFYLSHEWVGVVRCSCTICTRDLLPLRRV